MNNNHIAGVKGTNKTGGTTIVNANVVVLATGGFLSNSQMIEQEFGELYDISNWTNWSGSTRYQGDGINMALAIGAAKDITGTQPHDSQIPEYLHTCDLATHAPILLDTPAYLPNLWINKQGERFCDESVVISSAEEHGKQTMLAGGYYSVVDEATIDKFESEGQNLKYFMSTTDAPLTGLKDQIEIAESAGAVISGTINELAEKLNISVDILKSTLDEYNTYVESGIDEQFGKDAKYLSYKIDTSGKIYLFENVVRNLAAYGGLYVNGDLCVMNADGNPIEGLYATGLDALSFMGPIYNVTTVTASFAIASGYIAGNSIGLFLSN